MEGNLLGMSWSRTTRWKYNVMVKVKGRNHLWEKGGLRPQPCLSLAQEKILCKTRPRTQSPISEMSVMRKATLWLSVHKKYLRFKGRVVKRARLRSYVVTSRCTYEWMYYEQHPVQKLLPRNGSKAVFGKESPVPRSDLWSGSTLALNTIRLQKGQNASHKVFPGMEIPCLTPCDVCFENAVMDLAKAISG